MSPEDSIKQNYLQEKSLEPDCSTIAYRKSKYLRKKVKIAENTHNVQRTGIWAGLD